MNKEVNCSNFQGLISYLRKYYGDEGVYKVITGLVDNEKYLVSDKKNPSKLIRVQEHHLVDSAYWVSYEFTLRLFANAKRVLGGSNQLIKAGEEATIERFSKSAFFLSRIGSTKLVCKQATKLNAYFNRTKEVKLTDLTSNSARFELHYNPGFQAAKDICNWNLGIYTALAKVTGATDAKCQEIQCATEGNEHCVFLLTWKKSPNIFKRVVRRILQAISKDLMADFETAVKERDQLIDTLQQSEKSLKKSYDELDRLVEERTQELSHSYKLLEKEILERKQAEKQIKASLTEKELLLREVHHRVKNNFEIISSLLDMSRMRTENKETQSYLRNAQTRIHSMALIHDQLYKKDQFDRINMGENIKELVDSLSILYTSNEKRITPVVDSSQVYLSVNQAIPCSLVLNELISNAFKHGFNNTKQGTIRVSIDNSADNTVFIRIRDNGDGIPLGVDLNESSGLGLKMSSNLVTGQLNGKMWFNRGDGTEVCIQFKRNT